MYLKLVEKAFKEFLSVEGVDYAVVDTDSYGDCNTCVNSGLAETFGEDSKGIYLKHWTEGMNADLPISELDELYIAHDITQTQGEELYQILSKYFVVTPKEYDVTKTYIISSKVTTLEERIKELVETEYSDMKLSKKFSNRARLFSKCQEVICNEWKTGNKNIWNLVDKYVEEIIPEHLD